MTKSQTGASSQFPPQLWSFCRPDPEQEHLRALQLPRDGSQESQLAWSGAQGSWGCDYRLQGAPRTPVRISVVFPLACWEKFLEQV